ncbi:putative endogluconase [Tribonema minus]|uniref:Putative endogluconase n=1 Tax=Tribonema minus TaxID=303371 RepID=A0A835YY53_9STRA|nr:putative endogluconase [Tribonema minus]
MPSCSHCAVYQAPPGSNEQHHHGRKLPQCFDHITWTVSNGDILLNGQPFRVRGANWFGFETTASVVHGLWGLTTMDKVMDFLVANKFNALRIPFSLALALDPNFMIDPWQCMECTPDPSKPTSAWGALDRLFDKAAAKGLMIVLDLHVLGKGGGIMDLWYDDKYDETSVITGWSNMVRRWGSRANLMGIDLKNEPHGVATWALSTDSAPDKHDWGQAAERIAKALIKQYPSFDKLVIVEGVGADGADLPYPRSDPAYSKYWGSNLDGLYKRQLNFGSAQANARMVYSSHIYGPSVSMQPYDSAPNFPNNMPAIWDKQVGFVEGLTGKPVVIGEWGGLKKNVDLDQKLQAKWAQYMADKCIGDNFIWAINDNSADTKGLLTESWDVTKPNTDVLQLSKTAQTDPSIIAPNIAATSICVTLTNTVQDVCCATFCKQCGGTGCHTAANGGASNCCASNIKASGKYCTSNAPPCIR